MVVAAAAGWTLAPDGALRDHQQMATPTRPVLLREVTTLRQASRIAWCWARTFSTLRTRRRSLRWLQWFSFVVTWWANLLVVGIRAGDVVHCQLDDADAGSPKRAAYAAVIAGNAVTRPPRRLWRAIALAAALIVCLAGVAWLAAQLPLVSDLVTVLLLLVAIATLADRWPAMAIHRRGGNIARTRTALRQQHPGELQVLSMLGAWPPGHHLGWPLFDIVLHEYATTGVSVVLVARDAELAAQYVDRGGIVADPTTPLHIAWLHSWPPRTDVLIWPGGVGSNGVGSAAGAP